MGMNPDSNEFEELSNKERMEAFIDRFYSNERQNGDDIPIFQIGEQLVIKGYLFKVAQINKHQLVFHPIRPIRKAHDMEEARERLDAQLMELNRQAIDLEHELKLKLKPGTEPEEE